ncbi:hypothetical protein D9756_007215 [Leucocoprinus leucothites]|uniref:Uncharacterized protein n=1 Tax=Leucocoprinus leucothites TaxID=201217 RepID=A0A8H5D5U0_9AGAR|nr:hypothetical protein D9756_007215 [Leucoagaricus leucothites]
MPAEQQSRWIPGRYPAPGTSPIGDAIRQRRGERGITSLDAALLHVPPIAEGWNTLLGAVRTKGDLGGDVRELMILRVAAINGAAYEWIHHEQVGRQHGLTTAQLYIIRDITTPLPPAQGILNPLQSAALAFSDASTRTVTISDSITEDLRRELRQWVLKEHSGLSEEDVREKTSDLFVEAGLVVATYNMVSRFLVAVDVAGFSKEVVPWPLERQEYFFPIPKEDPTHAIHTLTLKSSTSAPCIVFVNSLLTDYTMWSLVLPYFIARDYNIVLFSQRGHGQSTLPSSPSSPPPPDSDPRTVTIPLLASDIHDILTSHLSIPSRDIKAIIGVSQGGATALAYAALYNEINDSAATAKSIIVCDTAPRTAEGSKAAWEERIALVGGEQVGGMKRLADITVPRWFPPGSQVSPQEDSSNGNNSRAEWVSSLITNTPVSGFEAGARALSSYDVLSLGLLESSVPSVLLLAGSLDGGGKVGRSLKQFGEEWNEKRRGQGRTEVEFVEVEGSGHLPMVDEPEKFWKAVDAFLAKV